MEISDDYVHPASGIYYISENIPSDLIPIDPDSVKLHDDYNSSNESCFCVGKCIDNASCMCINKSNNNFSSSWQNYTGIDGEIVLSDDAYLSDRPIYECNNNCSCSTNCGNRLVQFGPRKTLKIISTNSMGYGVINLEKIPKAGFICEYAGEIITKQVAVKRNLDNNVENKANYIICLNEYSGSKKIQTFIDPSVFGNIGRYLNHSCAPNCMMIPIRVLSPIPKLCLFAKQDIDEMSELTFSYAESCDRVSYENCRTKCLCKSVICKGWLPSEAYE